MDTDVIVIEKAGNCWWAHPKEWTTYGPVGFGDTEARSLERYRADTKPCPYCESKGWRKDEGRIVCNSCGEKFDESEVLE